MAWLPFFLYLFILSWLVTRLPFFRRSGYSDRVLVLLFLFKVTAAIAYGLVMGHSAYYRTIADTWRYQAESMDETELLIHHPGQWISTLFSYPYPEGYSKFFSTHDSYWNDLKFNFLVKILSVFNLFSSGHYYINALLFAFLSLFGWVALLRVYQKIFPGHPNRLLAAFLFMPSFIFWCGGIHKDGLVFTGLAIFFFHIFFALEQDGFSGKRLLGAGLGLLLILPQSNYLLLVLLPASIAWFLANRFIGRSWAWFLGIFVLCAILFFTSGTVYEKLNFPQTLVNKQAEFLNLEARSKMSGKPLEPNFGSFLQHLPQALNHILFRPYLWESGSLLYLVPAIELAIIYVLLILFLLNRQKKSRIHPAVLFGLFLSAGMLLIFSYSIPILGALVRYRAFYLPFLVIPLMASINWTTLKNRSFFKL